METKELIIQVPAGFEIDKENSSFERIVFKKKEIIKPKWDDFGMMEGFYISPTSNIISYSYHACNTNENTWPSKEEAEAALALSQLLQWRNKYNEGWKPDYNDSQSTKYVIDVYRTRITTDSDKHTSAPLVFKSAEIRKKFLEDFRDLIEIAKPLL